MTPNLATTDIARIRDVQLNFADEQLEVFITAPHGEIFRLRIGDETLGHLIDMTVFIQHSEVQHPIRMGIEAGREYRVRLYDMYNNVLDTYTFRAGYSLTTPYEMKKVQDGETFVQVQYIPSGIALPDTSDTSGFFHEIIPGLMFAVILVGVLCIYKFGRLIGGNRK
jgi:hypothetical protein